MQPISEPEIRSYVEKAIDGDVDAYGALYNAFVDRIFRYVFFQVRDRMKAEDITQDVFIKGWKAIHTCRGKEHTFSAWLYCVARNHVPAGHEDTEHNAEISVEWQKMMAAVNALPEPQKQIILLKFLEGADNNEIGDIMGKRQGAVRALQMRALKNLRRKINDGLQ
jgi:RNA polymerase sigma-70 factor (ECF subfamily)